MHEESDLIPLSALQHYKYCPRQCALIHLEQVWGENRFTAEGRINHEKVDGGGFERRGDVRRSFGVMIHSLRLGLSGKCDVVEFHRGGTGVWQPYPVEHKRGRRKRDDCDRVQLCAQAICLEEMLGIPIPEGALFYGKEMRREVVRIDDGLRRETESVADEVHHLFESGRTPLPFPNGDAKCGECSLSGVCLPGGVGAGAAGGVDRYLASVLEGR